MRVPRRSPITWHKRHLVYLSGSTSHVSYSVSSTPSITPGVTARPLSVASTALLLGYDFFVSLALVAHLPLYWLGLSRSEVPARVSLVFCNTLCILLRLCFSCGSVLIPILLVVSPSRYEREGRYSKSCTEAYPYVVGPQLPASIKRDRHWSTDSSSFKKNDPSKVQRTDFGIMEACFPWTTSTDDSCSVSADVL